MSQQQFHGRIDQVAAGDIKNFIEAPQAELKFISSAQRQILNALVAEISEECEADARMLWSKVVHARVGVEKIGEIPRERFMDAEDALVSWRDNHRRQSNIRLMVSRITSVTKDKRIYSERDTWCLRQFGEKQLNAMGTEQLRQVLAFVEDYAVAPQATAPTGWVAQMTALWSQQPLHLLATFTLGAIVGRLIL